jgi:hypothetical protein
MEYGRVEELPLHLVRAEWCRNGSTAQKFNLIVGFARVLHS